MKSIRLMLGLFFVLALSHTPARADDAADSIPSLIGEINIDQSSTTKDSYPLTQDRAIEYIKNLNDVIATLSHGAQGASIPTPTDNILSYLNAAYLYCAVNIGECPVILDAVLETDIINSRVSKIAQCPNMTRFWKLWVKSDMEARHKYLVKTGYLKTTSDFNQNKRPAYIKCQQTVASETAGSGSDEAYFKARYTPDSAHTLVAARTLKLIEEMKVKIPNLFAALGTSFGAASSAAAEPTSKRPKR